MNVRCTNDTYVFVDNEKNDNESVNVPSPRKSGITYFWKSDRITRITKVRLPTIFKKIDMHLGRRWRRSSVERQFKLAILLAQ